VSGQVAPLCSLPQAGDDKPAGPDASQLYFPAVLPSCSSVQQSNSLPCTQKPAGISPELHSEILPGLYSELHSEVFSEDLLRNPRSFLRASLRSQPEASAYIHS